MIEVLFEDKDMNGVTWEVCADAMCCVLWLLLRQQEQEDIIHSKAHDNLKCIDSDDDVQ